METEFIASKNNSYYYPKFEQEDNEEVNIKDEEIGRLRDELYACVQEIEDREKEITNLEVEIRRLGKLLKDLKSKVIKITVSTVLKLGIIFFFIDAVGIVFEPKERLFIGIGIFILFLGFLRALYMCIYHSRTDVLRINSITKLKSFTSASEECRREIECNRRYIVDLKEKIRQLREQIASLELREN